MKFEVKLQTVTPLFLGGANSDEGPELRPASVRGALRFWLRAALGGVLGTNDEALKTLHRLEAKVFGETERGSAVVVRITNVQDLQIAEEPLLPHKSKALTKAITRASFDLTLSLRPRANAKALEMSAWSALLWLSLGGIGRRSRRGAGSLCLKKVVTVPDEFPDDLKRCLNTLATPVADGKTLANHMGSLLGKAEAAFSAFASVSTPSATRGLPSFSALSSDTRVVVWTPKGTKLNDYKTVLTPLMDEMSSRKARLRNDFKDAFGGIFPRRASPLLVTAYRMEKEWALVLTHLKAKIRSNYDGKPKEVEQFLDDLILNEGAIPAYPRSVTGGTTP